MSEILSFEDEKSCLLQEFKKDQNRKHRPKLSEIRTTLGVNSLNSTTRTLRVNFARLFRWFRMVPLVQRENHV